MILKNQSCLLAFTLLMPVASAQEPQLEWAISTSGAHTKYIEDMAVDNEGNTIVIITSFGGGFSLAGVEFPFGPNSAGQTLIKIDPLGNILWHKPVKGSIFSAVEINENNIYLATSSASGLNPVTIEVGDFTVTSEFNLDDFLFKLDLDGNVMSYSSVAMDGASGLQQDQPTLQLSADEAIYRSGSLNGSIHLGGNTLENQGLSSIYVHKQDLNGNTLWAKLIGGVGFNLLPRLLAMDTDSEGNLYLAGRWLGDTLNIDHLSIVNDLAFTGNEDLWICKISAQGNAEWIARQHSANNNVNCLIAVSPEDELLVISNKLQADFNIGDFVLTGPMGTVLSHYDAFGTATTATILAENGGWVYSFAGNGTGAYYVGGDIFAPTFNFGGFELTNSGGTTGTHDAFVAKIDEDGEVDWIINFTGTGNENQYNIEPINAERFVVSVEYNSPEIGVGGTSTANSDLFVYQEFIASFGMALYTRTAEALLQLIAYPNPFSETLQFDAEALQAFGNGTLVVFNTSGVEVYREQLQDNGRKRISLAHLPAGAYVARFSDGKRSLHTKLVKH